MQQGVESGDRIVVGVNRYQERDEAPPEIQLIDETDVGAQTGRVGAFRAARDQEAVDAALREVAETARGAGNLLHPMREALRLGATLGEVSDALRAVFGEYQPGH